MDENNNNGSDNPTWFYSSESIIDVKHETIKTKYLFPFWVNITNPSWSGPGHRVSDVNTIPPSGSQLVIPSPNIVNSWNSSNSCPKMWSGSSRRQYPTHENIPDRFYFIVRVRPYHCIHYCSTEEEGGSGPGLINILLSRFPRPALMPTRLQTSRINSHASSIVDSGFMWLGLNYSHGKVD